MRHLSYGHAGDGNLHVNFLWNDDAERPAVERAIGLLMRATIDLGGTLSGEHGIGVTKAEYLPLEQSEELIALQRDVKRAFDPKGLLNPGKDLPERRAPRLLTASLRAARPERPIGTGCGAHDDAMIRVERLDLPPAARVDGDVTGPPEDIAGANLAQRHVDQARPHRARRAREPNASGRPGTLHETRAVEAGGTPPSPAVPMTYLRSRECDNVPPCAVGAGLVLAGRAAPPVGACATWCRTRPRAARGGATDSGPFWHRASRARGEVCDTSPRWWLLMWGELVVWG